MTLDQLQWFVTGLVAGWLVTFVVVAVFLALTWRQWNGPR